MKGQKIVHNMKKVFIFSVVGILLSVTVFSVVPAFAKQGADDKFENGRKITANISSASDEKINRSVASVINDDRVASPQDSKFTVSVKQDGTVKIQGKVVASPTAVATANRISVQSWFGVYTVDTTNAKVIRRYGGQGTISDIQIGDMIVFDGKANQNDMTITATVIRDLSAWTKDVNWVGDISNIDQTSRSFTFTIPSSPNMDRKPITLKVIVNSDAKVRVGNSEVPFTSLVNGMRARVYGLYNANTQSITARRVDARPLASSTPIVNVTSSATTTAQ